ncbi:HAMP domain-containing sensor histidine kinase [Chromatiaceae bacterium AAb-1]|nr:HAMP domain-containing sensor histidine kinase [Chromatiaceae bacterium AAb-1]
MTTSIPTIDFATVLASSVHDMKNSLCMLIQSAELIQQESAFLSENAREELARLNYEANRLNSNLLQLLTLYRLGKDQLPVQIDQHYLSDITEEILLKNHYLSSQQKIDISLDVPDDLAWFFDRDLITNLLNDIFVNALRYSRKQIQFTATTEHDRLIIEIHDDGPGFPELMLRNSREQMNNPDLGNSHTGLGLFFAKLIAQAHKHHGNTGSIELFNGGKLGGGVFRLTLP